MYFFSFFQMVNSSKFLLAYDPSKQSILALDLVPNQHVSLLLRFFVENEDLSDLTDLIDFHFNQTFHVKHSTYYFDQLGHLLWGQVLPTGDSNVTWIRGNYEKVSRFAGRRAKQCDAGLLSFEYKNSSMELMVI